MGRDIETVVLLVAGNDTCDRGNNPVDIAWEMDVRPPRFRFCVSLQIIYVLGITIVIYVL